MISNVIDIDAISNALKPTDFTVEQIEGLASALREQKVFVTVGVGREAGPFLRRLRDLLAERVGGPFANARVGSSGPQEEYVMPIELTRDDLAMMDANLPLLLALVRGGDGAFIVEFEFESDAEDESDADADAADGDS